MDEEQSASGESPRGSGPPTTRSNQGRVAIAELAPPTAEVVEPHGSNLLRSVFLRPMRMLEVVLSEQEKLARTIASGDNLVILVLGLLYATVLFSLPFGAVIGIERFWRVAVLLVGSLGICLPSLHVFGAYIGCRISIRQNLALGLVITCVAALFTFGFFPIVWFLDATIESESARVSVGHLGVVLLAFSVVAGIVHLIRCLRRFHGLVAAYPLVIIFWQALFIFITYRMARLLDLLP